MIQRRALRVIALLPIAPCCRGCSGAGRSLGLVVKCSALARQLSPCPAARGRVPGLYFFHRRSGRAPN